LIDPISGTWDEALVQQTFIASDANIILRIPIFEHEEDHLAWHYDEKGNFSAYHLQSMSISDDRQAVLLMVSEVVCGE
jgi:hypothetical protein